MRQKQTKILATISDLKCEVEFLKELYDNGVNCFRINTAHQTPDITEKVLANVRAVAEDVGILIDTKGPEIRTLKAAEELHFTKGDKIEFCSNDLEAQSTNTKVYVNYTGFVNEVPLGSMILVDDGEVAFTVIEKQDDKLICEVDNTGSFGPERKTVSVPEVTLSLPSLTEKDKLYVKYACENQCNFIAHSFVRDKNDVLAIKEITKEFDFEPKVIAKIENQAGVDNIDEILEVADGVMIARGDLAIEVPFQKVPVAQKHLTNTALRKGKIVIAATQMLHTMIKNPRATRAEINDVANAVYDGNDVIMLSGETAYGKYPVKSVQTMANIIKYTEDNMDHFLKKELTEWHDPVQNHIAYSAVKAAQQLPIKAIIVTTDHGTTPRLISSYRSHIPIFAKCSKRSTVQDLSLCHGIFASYAPDVENRNKHIVDSLKELFKEHVNENDLVLLIGSHEHDHRGSYIEIKTVKDAMNAAQKEQ